LFPSSSPTQRLKLLPDHRGKGNEKCWTAEEVAKDNWYTNENKKPSENDSSVLNTRTEETDKESQDRRNKNRVNSQLADIAGVSTAKVFRYKEILEHGTIEEVGGL
jgi:hypothetical protein